MNFSRIGLATAFVIAGVVPASALTITNRDPSAQKIVVMDTEGETEVTIAPAKAVDNVCMEGCVIRMPNGEEYDVDAQDVVYIQGGALNFEGETIEQDPDDQDAPDAGSDSDSDTDQDLDEPAPDEGSNQ